MTDESRQTSLSNDNKTSSWNLDSFHTEDESDSSSDFFSVLRKSVAKHVYYNDQNETNNRLSNDHSTVRVDSSDLISRCKDFLPLLTDANQRLFSKIESGENVRMELDSDQENEERIIEMNLMFCPDVDSSSESDESTTDYRTPSLKLNTNKNQVNIIEISPTDITQEKK